MRQLLVTSMVLSVLAVGAPAGARLTTSTTVQQSFFGSMSQNMPTGVISGQLSVLVEVGVTSVGPAAAPAARFEASGTVSTCDLMWYCTSMYFPQQVINPTALSMDPAGNSGTFRACLVPTSGPCATFDIAITRPASLNPQCAPVCVNPNAWYDPTTGTVGGGVHALVGVLRYGYRISGVWADTPIAPSTSGFTQYTFGLVHASNES